MVDRSRGKKTSWGRQGTKSTGTNPNMVMSRLEVNVPSFTTKDAAEVHNSGDICRMCMTSSCTRLRSVVEPAVQHWHRYISSKVVIHF